MRGFDNKFKDFPDYIIGITKEVWEDRGLGEAMERYYHPDVYVRMPGVFARGEKGATAATMATLVQFPDRTLLGGRRNLVRHAGRGDVVVSPDPLNGDASWGRRIRRAYGPQGG
jgi:hypothetical protein